MLKTLKIIGIAIAIAVLLFLLFVGSLALSVVIQGNIQEDANAKEQIERIAALKSSYADGNAKKVDERTFLDFDYGAIDSIKYNELRAIGTHNSYKKEYSASAKIFSKIAFPLIGMGANDSDYYHENFTDQLNSGLRTFEFDIAKKTGDSGDTVTVVHAPYFDGNSWASDFALALEEIAMWSRYNVGHMPITILLEVKADFLLRPDVKKLENADIGFLNGIIRDALGDRLMTPSDMLALSGSESLKSMRESGAFPALRQMTDKVLCLLHPGGLSDAYAEAGISDADMFIVGAKYDDAVFDLLNNPKDVEKIQNRVSENFIVRTRINQYAYTTDETYDEAMRSNAQILNSDYVPRVNPKDGEYVTTFSGGKTMSLISR